MQRNISQLLIVDIQDKVLSPISNKKDIVKKAARLIQSAKILGVPITVSEQNPKGSGSTVESLRNLLGGDAAYFGRMHFSCLKDDALRLHLEKHHDAGRGQVILAGAEAHLCVAQTAFDLIINGYEAFIAADAVGSRLEMSRELGLRRLEKAGAFIVDSEMVLFEWLEKAGTPEFRALQDLIK